MIIRGKLRAIYGLYRNDPKKTLHLSVSYKFLFTLFPQMWIIEIKISKRGKLRIYWIKVYYNPLFAKFKYFFSTWVMPPFHAVQSIFTGRSFQGWGEPREVVLLARSDSALPQPRALRESVDKHTAVWDQY
jgi:hypothetical protein